MDSFNGAALPKEGARITYANGKYTVPDNPIIPFIEGDGTGRDIWKASVRVFDAAVNKAYGSKRKIAWYERSEEHTSELQSRRDLVCRLLLEKKNTTNNR